MIQMNAVIDGGRLFSAKMAEARGDKVGSSRELVIAGVVRMGSAVVWEYHTPILY